jgi:hypothetical protein
MKNHQAETGGGTDARAAERTEIHIGGGERDGHAAEPRAGEAGAVHTGDAAQVLDELVERRNRDREVVPQAAVAGHEDLARAPEVIRLSGARRARAR